MLHRMRTQAKGFTLLELLIVVAIIGVLAAIAIPNFVSASTKSRYGRALADTKLIVSQSTLYVNDNPGLVPNLAAIQAGAYMSTASDPFVAAGTNYQYAAAAGTAIAAWSVGADRVATVWAGAGAITVDDVGNSSTIGCSVGPTATTTYSVRC